MHAKILNTSSITKYMYILFPVLAAFITSAIILWALDKDPIAYYTYVVQRALFSSIGLEAVILKMVPLLLISAGLIIAFKSGIWNLGADGQFLLAAVITASIAPKLALFLPVWGIALCSIVLAMCTGAFWAWLPALLKVKYGLNEVITTLMTSFIGISLANILIKFPFRDINIPHPQTLTLPLSDRLTGLFDTNIHVGVLIAIGVLLAVHVLMYHTSIGLKLRIMGINIKAAHHAGYNVNALTYFVFFASAGLIGMAGAIEILGVYGTVQANWNPAYGMLAIPLVFLAKFNGILIIAFALLFSVLLVGGESASRGLDVPTYYISVLLALFMIFIATAEVIYNRKINKG